MIYRWLAGEFREFPATMTFGVAWVMVFIALLSSAHLNHLAEPWSSILITGVGNGHVFGDLTLTDIGHGQIWRLTTSTFVHYSLMHLTLNLLAFYQLGTLLESWYGSHQFVLVYGLTAAGGNLISAVARSVIGASPQTHSGGGSVVVMGLVSVCAVVGLRAGSKVGRAMGWQMVFFMGLTAAIGVAFPRYIDNWGHLGGAIVGLAIGAAHQWMIRRARRPSAWAPGIVAGLVIMVCAVCQFGSARAEAQRDKLIEQDQRAWRLQEIDRILAFTTASAGSLRDDQARLLLSQLSLLGIDSFLRDSNAALDLRAAHELIKLPRDCPLDAEERKRLDGCLARVRQEIRARYVEERTRYWNRHRGTREGSEQRVQEPFSRGTQKRQGSSR
jgi:rhomboid protease GluP